MKDRENILKQLSQMKLPRVFRQNILFIFMGSMLISVFYYPFFLFNRGKYLIRLQNMKRKYLNLIMPFIGLITMFIVSAILVVVISRKENVQLDEISSVRHLVDVVSNGKYPFYTVANQVARIFALLCFVVPLSDLLIQLSEKMKNVKAILPKIIANTPAIFTIVGLLYVLSEVLQIEKIAHVTGMSIVMETIFVTSIVLSHIYIVNVYVLFTAIKLPMQEGEN